MRKFWWELIFAWASLTMALIALRTEGITPADGTWWVIVAGFTAWNSLLSVSSKILKNGGGVLDNPCP